MANTINMEDLRHLNLFAKITKVNTRYLFRYNNMLVFFVPKKLVPRATGKDLSNLRKLSKILNKRIRIVATPNSIEDVEETIKKIIHPITFREMKIEDDIIQVSAGKMNKSMLIGRNKLRLKEMNDITRFFFKKEFKII